MIEQDDPRVDRDPNNYTIGRGVVTFNGQMLRSTRVVQMRNDPGRHLSIVIGVEDITDDLMALWLSGGKEGIFEYASNNPAGRQFRIEAEGRLVPGDTDMKTTDWMAIMFTLHVNRDDLARPKIRWFFTEKINQSAV